MSTRIVVPPKAAEQPTAPASTYDVGQKVKAAGWAGLFAAGLVATVSYVVLILSLLIEALPVPPWEAWVVALGLALVAGLVVACRLGYRWVVAAAARPWAVDDEIRERAWRLEDEERRAQEAAVDQAADEVRTGPLDHDDNPSTLNEAQLLHLVAIEVLRRHYVHGAKVTREAMTSAGCCTQPQWNAVNAAMKAIGLKRNNTMAEGLTFQEAWEIWQASVEIRPGQRGAELWYQTRQGAWKMLEEV